MVESRPDDPVLTDQGIPLPAADEVAEHVTEDDEVYEIDRVLRAERLGNRFRLWIKWKGFADATPMWKHDLERESSNAELRREIDEAVQRCRDEELRHDDEPEPPAAPATDDQVPRQYGRGHRVRKQIVYTRCMRACGNENNEDLAQLLTHVSVASEFAAACDFFCAPRHLTQGG